MVKFGEKMVIEPFSIPEYMKESWLKSFYRWANISILGCWDWTGRIHNGYPCIWATGWNSTLWAHRVSYALFIGPIEEGMHIDHKCRNPICVRPSHLEQVTPSENYLRIYQRITDIDEKALINGTKYIRNT